MAKGTSTKPKRRKSAAKKHPVVTAANFRYPPQKASLVRFLPVLVVIVSLVLLVVLAATSSSKPARTARSFLYRWSPIGGGGTGSPVLAGGAGSAGDTKEEDFKPENAGGGTSYLWLIPVVLAILVAVVGLILVATGRLRLSRSVPQVVSKTEAVWNEYLGAPKETEYAFGRHLAAETAFENLRKLKKRGYPAADIREVQDKILAHAGVHIRADWKKEAEGENPNSGRLRAMELAIGNMGITRNEDLPYEWGFKINNSGKKRGELVLSLKNDDPYRSGRHYY